MSLAQKKKALRAIFIVILSDITALGMIIPLTPILARDFGAEGFKIGLLISSYSIVQFLMSPLWGRLSDVFGRKPIILLGLCGTAFSYLLFAFSSHWMDILISRALAGFFGGNVIIATAYIADLTSRQNRSKNLGLIGMAFGGGFTIGPFLGFLFMFFGEKMGAGPPFGLNFSAMGASLFCLFNFTLSFFFLGESLLSKQKLSQMFQKKKSSPFVRPSFQAISQALKSQKLGPVLIMSFMLLLSLAQIEPVLILLVQDDFLWSQKTAYSSFIYIGLLMVFSQGYLVRKWIPKWGESLISRSGLLIMSMGLMAIALSGGMVSPSSAFFSPAFFVLLLGVTFFSIGYSLSSTSLNGALSLITSPKDQGSLFGVNQSLSAMARIIGPAVGGWFYQNISHESPFLMGGLWTLMALSVAFCSKKDFPNAGQIKS